MSNVCYFEIPVNDTAKSQSFYTSLFGWQFEKMSGSTAEKCDYWHINTGTPDEPGTAIGGMMTKQDPKHTITQYINVACVATSLEKACQLGATQIMPKTAVPNMGYFAVCLDLDRNTFGLWQADETAQ